MRAQQRPWVGVDDPRTTRPSAPHTLGDLPDRLAKRVLT
jgi:hypothetical protein